MTKLQKEECAAAIKPYMTYTGLSQNDLAHLLDISSATLTQMRKGNWDNISEKMWLRVWNEVNPQTISKVIQTSDTRKVTMLIRDTVTNKLMSGLIGDTGMGKTTMLELMRKTNPNVFYYYIDGTVSPRTFLKELLRLMGVPFEGSLNAMHCRIADELLTRVNPLLIIDECAKMSDKMMLILHSLRDKTQSNCGIVLAGMPIFKNNLIKQQQRGTVGYAEFYRRINIWHEMKGLSKSEIVTVLEANGITDKDEQTEYRHLYKFGDLLNAIYLNKTVENNY